MRNLAQRSASAAKEIKTLINDSVEKVDLGTRLVDEAGITMQEVVDSVKRVSDIISEITAAGAEQSSGIDQINTAIIQMDQVTQQNAALVEEAAAAAGALQEQAANLSRVVGVFKLHNVHAGSGYQPQVVKPAAKLSAQTQKPGSGMRKLPQVKAVQKEREMAKTDQDWEEF